MNTQYTGLIALCVLLGCNSGQDVTPKSTSAKKPVANGDTAKLKPSPQVIKEKSDASVQPQFVNVAAAMGLEFEYFEDRVPGRFFLPEVMGGGVGWGDFDRDGWTDLYLMNGAVLDPSVRAVGESEHRNVLFRNIRGDRMTNVGLTANAADSGYGQGCAIGDFDADGFGDVYLCNYGRNALLSNNGDGTFGNFSGVEEENDGQWSSSAVWVDLNADGNLDLYCVNYMDCTLQNSRVCQYGESSGYCGPGNYEGVADVVLLNTGDGQFRDATIELGFGGLQGKGLAVAVSDFDKDFYPDIYVANDMEANNLFVRTVNKAPDNGTGSIHYRDVAPESGCAVSGEGLNEASMGIACADFDGDGLVDLYLTHYYQMKNTLYHNLGGGQFEDDSFRTGVAATSFPFLGFGVVSLDVDQDRHPDLFVANGHVLGPTIDPNAMTPQLLLNDGRGNFKDQSRTAGAYFEDVWLGRGAAGADFDDDGDLDICVSHIDRPVALLRNDTTTGKNFITVQLVCRNRTPCHCARVTMSDGIYHVSQVFGAGGSYLSSSDDRLHFAVQGSSSEVRLLVEWPSGHSELYDALRVNRGWQITEGRAPSESVK